MAEIINADNLILKLENIANIDVQEALDRAGYEVEEQARQNLNSAGRVDTGELWRSIAHEVIGNECIIGTDVAYAPYVEYGTGIHASNGKGRQTPWCYWKEKTHTVNPPPTHFHIGYRKDGSKYVYWTDETWQPDPYETHFYWTTGMEPRPFLHPALEQCKARIEAIFQETINKEMEKS